MCQSICRYELPVYNKRKIKDFADVLSGFATLLKLSGVFGPDVQVRELPVCWQLFAADGTLFCYLCSP
jgi:hypothetical protein